MYNEGAAYDPLAAPYPLFGLPQLSLWLPNAHDLQYEMNAENRIFLSPACAGLISPTRLQRRANLTRVATLADGCEREKSEVDKSERERERESLIFALAYSPYIEYLFPEYLHHPLWLLIRGFSLCELDSFSHDPMAMARVFWRYSKCSLS